MTTNITPIKIILADEHEIFRDGFRLMIKKIPSIKLVAEVAGDRQLISMARHHKPDVIITNIPLIVEKNIEATKRLIARFPSIRIIAMSMCEDERKIARILSTGVKGYLQKDAGKQEIVAAVKAVVKDRTYYCKNTTQKLASMIKNNSNAGDIEKTSLDFTEKELMIMRLICEELSNKEMADKLGLSKRTIEGYREKILEKINAKNTAGIVVYAIKNNIYHTSTMAV